MIGSEGLLTAEREEVVCERDRCQSTRWRADREHDLLTVLQLSRVRRRVGPVDGLGQVSGTREHFGGDAVRALRAWSVTGDDEKDRRRTHDAEILEVDVSAGNG